MRARTTDVYLGWIDSLKDITSRARIQVRVDRLVHGHAGAHRRLSGGICELKMDFGPGYRVYYIERRDELVLLLGGDKRTQRRDIRKALALAKGI
jgi:putative addiction module killer protein